MRRIAHELQVEAMSLYYHIPSRAALDKLIIADILQMITANPDVDWSTQIRGLLTALHEAASTNPVLRVALWCSLEAHAPENDLTSRVSPLLHDILQRSSIAPKHLDATHRALLAVTAAFATDSMTALDLDLERTRVIDNLLS